MTLLLEQKINKKVVAKYKVSSTNSAEYLLSLYLTSCTTVIMHQSHIVKATTEL